ncbi:MULTISPECIES: hypothetical protein [Chryseobacterium]|uniref:Uncharacterized protein n=1 Tax=Chryseobacterium scophthalmum TaxID=59733 RepID=A0A1N6FEK3_9FLAO|nr:MULTISPECIES: hypothetical protein [Chryseobacterium]MBM7419415.1 transcription initiation factor IIE alpha subunit [Chryseobacterium sp. JUb44]MDH6209340.1 transcription initiation factor IIE alpha subunit [Chryseobacterium sp. BIGb0186]WSO12178.1 hypothetical protein VUJ64_09745 [Chryseobacterium scophthalmum]SIN93680.1 hypothetical protein SAMN05421769_1241 [Chryseobacterium scophthalmum]
MNQTLQCPQCKSEITFNAQALIAGATFTCTTCECQIRMSPSSMNQAKKVYDKFTELKKKIAQK